MGHTSAALLGKGICKFLVLNYFSRRHLCQKGRRIFSLCVWREGVYYEREEGRQREESVKRVCVHVHVHVSLTDTITVK